jgi:hypothetical protein
MVAGSVDDDLMTRLDPQWGDLGSHFFEAAVAVGNSS